MFHDETRCEGSTGGDGDERNGEALPVVVGVRGEVGGFCFAEWFVGENLDAADEVGDGDVLLAGAG